MKEKEITKKQLRSELHSLQERVVGLEKVKVGHQRTQQALHESMELYQTLVEISPDAITLTDLQGKIIMVNQETVKLHGFDDMQEMIGKNAFELIVPEDRKRAQENLKKTLTEGSVRAVEYRLLKKDRTVFYADISASLINSAAGEPRLFIGVTRDISKRLRLEEEIEDRIEFRRLITNLLAKFIDLKTDEIEKGINSALIAIGEFAKVDRNYIFLLYDKGKKMHNAYEWCAPGIAPQLTRLQGLTVDDYLWVMQKIKRFETVYIPRVDDLPLRAELLKKELQAEKIKSLIMVPMSCAGKIIGFLGFDSVRREKQWLEDEITLLRISGEMFASVLERRRMDEDIQNLNKELLKANGKLKQLALRDPHTGLYNHRYFEDVITSEFVRAKRHDHPLSVIMLDIDYFKSINDVYGHHFGDLVLKQLSVQLKRMVRKYDTVIRFGGEEFIIITPGAGQEIALILAQRLLEVIKLYNFGDKQHKVKLKLSVAVAAFPEDKIVRGIDFIKITEYILSKAKEIGGDRVYSSRDLKRKKPLLRRKHDRAADVKLLRGKLGKLTKRTNESLAEAIFAFAKTIEIKDHYTGAHVEKTVHYATKIAEALGLTKEEAEKIRQASILHDLGKVGISEKILLKKTKLTKKEYEAIKNHSQIGVDILRPIHFFHEILPLILHHHERWDGKGYPEGLKEEETPIGARIIAVADAYEALTSDRRYRRACSKKIAVEKIKKSSGTQFDPKIVKEFLEVLKTEK